MTAPLCRVFLVGEGPSDIGDLARERAYQDGKEGFFQPILRRIAEPFELELDGCKLTTLKATPPKRARTLRKSKAAQALALAREAQCHALVLARDLDREGGRPASAQERRKRWAVLTEDLQADLREAKDADPDLAGIATIVAVPIRMIEAWVMGDRKALANANGGALKEEPPDGSPEAYWGERKNPRSDHPKWVLERAVGHVSFAAVAEHARVAAIEESCPDSFAPFAAAVRDQVRECAGARSRGR